MRQSDVGNRDASFVKNAPNVDTILNRARKIAIDSGKESVETSHLILSIIDDDILSTLLDDFGLEVGELKEKLKSQMSKGDSTVPDETKQCIDCKKDFVLTESEKTFFMSKRTPDGIPFVPPKRCPACRKRRKMERDNPGNFAQGNV